MKLYGVEENFQEKVLDLLVNHLIRMQFYHLILETNASEHAARRMAMMTMETILMSSITVSDIDTK